MLKADAGCVVFLQHVLVVSYVLLNIVEDNQLGVCTRQDCLQVLDVVLKALVVEVELLERLFVGGGD